MSTANPFADLRFDDFKRLAAEPGLSRHEKVGFPDSYRQGKEDAIFADVCAKLPRLQRQHGLKVLEIGPGCSQLPVMLAELCARQGHELTFIDSAEMLALLPDGPHIHKLPGAFPQALDAHTWRALVGQVDVIVAYSVIQYIFTEGNLWDAVDRCLMLLRDGGETLLADVPNVSMRKRHFASPAGHAQHRAYTGQDAPPDVQFNTMEPGQMDDSVVLSLLARARAQGCHGWVLPQAPDLPMANRREDLLFRKP